MSRHFLITAHLCDCEDETFHVIAADPILAMKAVEDHLKALAVSDHDFEEGDDIETYIMMVAEIPGAPYSVSSPFGEDSTPVTLMAPDGEEGS